MACRHQAISAYLLFSRRADAGLLPQGRAVHDSADLLAFW